MEQRDLTELTKEELEELVTKLGEPSYRADQLLHWMHKLNVLDYSKMTNLPKSLREKLEEKYPFLPVNILEEKRSFDGTIKLLIQLADNEKIETVIMPYEDRTTVCISSQVGCPLNCSFCQTGKIGFIRNLTATEIIRQLKIARKYVTDKRLNVVFMGMGEPMLNIKEVIKASRIMTAQWGMDISKRRLTISTAGIVPGIYELGKSGLGVNLSISLNATTDEVRNKLMPINKKYPIKSIIKACRDFPLKKSRRITFEYVMIKNVNDSEEDALRLVKLLKGIKSKVNLIPYNSIKSVDFEKSDMDTILKFQEILFSHNISAFIRDSRGVDIEGACGQLYASYNNF